MIVCFVVETHGSAPQQKNYSYLITSTGFAVDAKCACHATVTTAITIVTINVNTNGRIDILV